MPDALGFDEWVEALEMDLGEEPGDEGGRRRRVFLMRWLRNLYDQMGPLPRDETELAFILDQVRLAEQNTALVMRDIERTDRHRPTIEVDDYCGSVRIAVDSSYTTPSVWEWANPAALVETAAYIQEQLMDDGVWPHCPVHGQYLRPEERGGAAVWFCVTGDHAVALVGELGAANTG